MQIRELAGARMGGITPPVFDHINRQSPPEPHTAMYVWHSYWSRKTWNVVNEHIQAYTREQQVVFDPFAGKAKSQDNQTLLDLPDLDPRSV